MTVVTGFIQAVSHGGTLTRPTLIVIHSAETPLKAGYATSIATNWFGKSATTSAHFIADPAACIRMLSDNVVAYHVGPNANGFTLGIEQAGYAAFTRAQWTTTDGQLQIFRVGGLVAELAAAHGIPLRWATDAQIRAAANGVPGGVCYHNDIHRVLGGTTHTDPMPNYPGDLLEAVWSGKTPPATGGDFLMALTDDEQRRILKFADDWSYLLPTVKGNTDLIPAAAKTVAEIGWGVNDPEQGLRVAVSGLYAKVAQSGTQISAADIAALIPDSIAKDVADELAKRMAA